MDEKKVREEYLEFPWGIADTIKNLRALKSILQQQVKKQIAMEKVHEMLLR